MRALVDIYEKHRIPPWIQEHQLRVAGVGAFLARRIQGADEPHIILTGLFHDMGNILKTDFSTGNPLLSLIGEENLARWQKIKDDFIANYGANEHSATNAIAEDIGLSESVQALIRDMGFSKIPEILKSGSIELQIIEYADQRTGPHGILPLDERFAEGQIRYRGRYGELDPTDVERREKSMAAAHEIEQSLCEQADIRPEDITDASIASIIEDLKKYVIP